MSVLASLAIGVGAGLAGSALSHYLGQRSTEKNMQSSYEMGQQAQRNSLVNFMHSAQAAGINPAVAAAGAGSAFSNPVGPNAPQGHAPQMPNFIEMAQVMQNQDLVDSQVKVADSEVLKNEAEADSIISATIARDRENARHMSEDDMIDKRIRDYFLAQGDEEAANRALKYDFGSLSGLDKFDQYMTDISSRKLKMLDNELMSKIKSHQIDDKYGLWKIISEMPKYQRMSIYDDIALNAARVKNLAQMDMTEEKNRVLIDSQSRKMLADIDRAYNTDFVGNVKDGHYFDALMILVGQGASAFAHGVGEGVGESLSPLGKSKIKVNESNSKRLDRMR